MKLAKGGVVIGISDEFKIAAPLSNAHVPLAPSANKNKLDVLGEQYFVAMFGGANDAWNFCIF